MNPCILAAVWIASLQTAFLLGPLQAQPSSAKPDPRVEALLRRMTLEEKVGQLSQIGGVAFIPNAPKPEVAIRQGQAGSILWVTKATDINRLQKIAMEETRLHIPLIFGLDVIHGFRTLFPMPLALAASWDTSLIERVQGIAAKEARAAGITWTFAPMVDIARDPRWGRLIEGAGEDPYLGSAVARAQVKGFQGDDVSSLDHLLPAPNTLPPMAPPRAAATTTPPTSPMPSFGTSTCRPSMPHSRPAWRPS